MVHDKMPPGGFGIRSDRARYMGDKVLFGPCRSERWGHDLALGHIEIRDERQRAMANVLDLTSFHAPRSHRDGRMFAFQSLDPGHLVRGDHTFPCGVQGRRLQVQVSHIGHFLISGLFRRAVEPVTTPVRFAVDLILKNARRGALRWSRRCRV